MVLKKQQNWAIIFYISLKKKTFCLRKDSIELKIHHLKVIKMYIIYIKYSSTKNQILE